MKEISNSNNVWCIECDKIRKPVLFESIVICPYCGSQNLVKDHARFEPKFISKTFRASKYAPELIDRRRVNRFMPISKERRNPYGTSKM